MPLSREEAHDNAPFSDSYMKWGDLHFLIDRIYDDFESKILELETSNTDLHNELIKLENKTCESCEWLEESDYSGWNSCHLEVAEEITYPEGVAVVSNMFCCNKWEAKE